MNHLSAIKIIGNWMVIYDFVSLARLEEENRHLPQVEIDEVSSFMCDIRAKVSAHYAMPCWVVLFVELFLDVCSNILK